MFFPTNSQQASNVNSATLAVDYTSGLGGATSSSYYTTSSQFEESSGGAPPVDSSNSGQAKSDKHS